MNELFTKGTTLYPRALATIDEFIRQARRRWSEAVEDTLNEINTASGTSVNSEPFKDYLVPAKLFDGSKRTEIRLGVQICPKKEEGWNQLFYLYWDLDGAEKEHLKIAVSTNFRSKGRAKVAYDALPKALKARLLYDGYTEIYMSRSISPDETARIDELLRETIRKWCAAWRDVGDL